MMPPSNQHPKKAAPTLKRWQGNEMRGLAAAICKLDAVEAVIFDLLNLVKTNTTLGANVDEGRERKTLINKEGFRISIEPKNPQSK